MWTVLSAVAWAVIILPSGLLTLVWFRSPKQRPFPLASWGISLLLLSFCFVPWIDLQPLKHFGVEWLFDAVPILAFIFERLGKTLAVEVAEKVSSLEIIFEPPGWITLVMVGNWLIWLWLAFWGSLTFIFAIPVMLRFRWRPIGRFLSITSFVLLITLFYNLPNIDGLGERPLPSIFALAEPILGAQLLWQGPMIMMAGLGLLVFGGLSYAYSADQMLDRDDMRGEEDEAYL